MQFPSTGSSLGPAQEAEGPSEREKEADLIGFIDFGVHTVLDHLLHQQRVGLVTDLSKPKRRQVRGGGDHVNSPDTPASGASSNQPPTLFFSLKSPAIRTRLGKAPLTSKQVSKQKEYGVDLLQCRRLLTPHYRFLKHKINY